MCFVRSHNIALEFIGYLDQWQMSRDFLVSNQP
jgi:hypothetical protein